MILWSLNAMGEMELKLLNGNFVCTLGHNDLDLWPKIGFFCFVRTIIHRSLLAEWNLKFLRGNCFDIMGHSDLHLWPIHNQNLRFFCSVKAVILWSLNTVSRNLTNRPTQSWTRQKQNVSLKGMGET